MKMRNHKEKQMINKLKLKESWRKKLTRKRINIKEKSLKNSYLFY